MADIRRNVIMACIHVVLVQLAEFVLFIMREASRESTTHFSLSRSCGTPVSSREEILLRAKTLGRTSRNIWCVARTRKQRPAEDEDTELDFHLHHEPSFSGSASHLAAISRTSAPCCPCSRKISAMFSSFAVFRAAVRSDW